MRWPLYLTVNVCLIALVGAGAFRLFQQDGAAQAARSAALDQGLDRLIAAWTASGTPPEARVLRIFVASEPDETTWNVVAVARATETDDGTVAR